MKYICMFLFGTHAFFVIGNQDVENLRTFLDGTLRAKCEERRLQIKVGAKWYPYCHDLLNMCNFWSTCKGECEDAILQESISEEELESYEKILQDAIKQHSSSKNRAQLLAKEMSPIMRNLFAERVKAEESCCSEKFLHEASKKPEGRKILRTLLKLQCNMYAKQKEKK
ncbi:MAG TPA: hypothetical protein VEK38_03105 [Candidatus Bathyarchaeia archaeon]|nr:hypothetical protein [Candidatus Bathyarchaeia archaeon]